MKIDGMANKIRNTEDDSGDEFLLIKISGRGTRGGKTEGLRDDRSKTRGDFLKNILHGSEVMEGKSESEIKTLDFLRGATHQILDGFWY